MQSRLDPAAVSRTFDKDAVVVPEGRVDGRMWFVCSGAFISSETHPTGRRHIVEFLRPGDAFGEGWLRGIVAPHLEQRAPEVRALVPSRVVIWPRWAAEEAWQSDEAFRAWVTARFLDRLDRSRRTMARTLGVGVAERLEELLVDLGNAFGRPVAEGLRIELPLSQETLAAAVGAARESVNRAVHALEVRGRLRRRGRLYTLVQDRATQAVRS
jgi:CRP/FNR family cyclic AMP-dependent transcriptional regulator